MSQKVQNKNQNFQSKQKLSFQISLSSSSLQQNLIHKQINQKDRKIESFSASPSIKGDNYYNYTAQQNVSKINATDQDKRQNRNNLSQVDDRQKKVIEMEKLLQDLTKYRQQLNQLINWKEKQDDSYVDQQVKFLQQGNQVLENLQKQINFVENSLLKNEDINENLTRQISDTQFIFSLQRQIQQSDQRQNKIVALSPFQFIPQKSSQIYQYYEDYYCRIEEKKQNFYWVIIILFIGLNFMLCYQFIPKSKQIYFYFQIKCMDKNILNHLYNDKVGFSSNLISSSMNQIVYDQLKIKTYSFQYNMNQKLVATVEQVLKHKLPNFKRKYLNNQSISSQPEIVVPLQKIYGYYNAINRQFEMNEIFLKYQWNSTKKGFSMYIQLNQQSFFDEKRMFENKANEYTVKSYVQN